MSAEFGAMSAPIGFNGYERSRETTMTGSKGNFLTAAALAAGLLASTSAFAGTVTVDGVNVPIGFSPGGYGLTSQLVTESLVTAVGQTAQGVGTITNIVQLPSSITWTQGQNNTYLAFMFNGFVADSVSNTQITFTGGTIDVYAFTGSPPSIDGNGSIATDFANIQAGTLWLSLAAQAQDASGHTLVVTIPAGYTTTNFLHAGGSALLDVTGGDAAGNFKTCTFAAPDAPNGCVDLLYNQDSSVGTTASDFNINGLHVDGTSDTRFNAIPEPATLGMMGAGLLALGLFRRRSRKARS